MPGCVAIVANGCCRDFKAVNFDRNTFQSLPGLWRRKYSTIVAAICGNCL